MNGRVADSSESVVVSLGRLTVAHGGYYEREVAGPAQDYHAMRGEAQSEWVGSGSFECHHLINF